MAELFKASGIIVKEIHSRKSQTYRTRTSEEFRKEKRGIMFSSDVTARGMDYPDVTMVVQMGLTTRDQYIHRLGRTARAGKEGCGMLLCTTDEEKVLRKELQDMPLASVGAARYPALIGPLSEVSGTTGDTLRALSVVTRGGSLTEAAEEVID